MSPKEFRIDFDEPEDSNALGAQQREPIRHIDFDDEDTAQSVPLFSPPLKPINREASSDFSSTISYKDAQNFFKSRDRDAEKSFLVLTVEPYSPQRYALFQRNLQSLEEHALSQVQSPDDLDLWNKVLFYAKYEEGERKDWIFLEKEITKVISRLIDKTLRDLEALPQRDFQFCFESVCGLASLSKELQARIAPFLEKHHSVVVEGLENTFQLLQTPNTSQTKSHRLHARQWVGYAGLFVHYGNEALSQPIQQKIEKFASIYPEAYASFFSEVLSGERSDVNYEKVERQLLSYLETQYGISQKDIVSVWDKNIGEGVGKRKTNLRSNLDMIISLSRTMPKAAKVLFDNDLYCLGRYPLYSLQKTCEAMSHPEKQKFIVLYAPKTDWNGAFYQKNVLEELEIQLISLGYTLQIREVSSLRDILLQSLALKTLCGEASGAILGGHGSIENLQLDTNSYLSVKDLFRHREGQIAKKALFRFLEQFSTLVLWSCSAGKDNALGQWIYENTGIRVVAGDADSRFAELRAQEKNGVLQLNATFDEGNTRIFE